MLKVNILYKIIKKVKYSRCTNRQVNSYRGWYNKEINIRI